MINIFESYKKPDEFVPLLEMNDYNDKKIYYYFKMHELYKILFSI
jgi:hypothetical protein